MNSGLPPGHGMQTMQARLKQNTAAYNINRDLAHNWTKIANFIAVRLEDGLWPELADLLKREGVTMDDLGEGCKVYCTFIGTAADDPKEDVRDALDRCGWFKLSPVVQIALMATLGTIVTGMQFNGVREATLGGEGPAQTLPEVMNYGKRVSDFLAQPRWKRTLVLWRARLGRAFAALLGRS